MTCGVRTEYSTSRIVEVYDEWLTDRSREAIIELSKFSFVLCVIMCKRSAKDRLQAIGIYSLDVPRAIGKALAQHEGQSGILGSITESNM